VDPSPRNARFGAGQLPAVRPSWQAHQRKCSARSRDLSVRQARPSTRCAPAVRAARNAPASRSRPAERPS
jgi:hypothetical protein